MASVVLFIFRQQTSPLASSLAAAAAAAAAAGGVTAPILSIRRSVSQRHWTFAPEHLPLSG